MSHTDIALTEDDIPGASLNERLDNKHTVSSLRWWLLCPGNQLPNIIKKTTY